MSKPPKPAMSVLGAEVIALDPITLAMQLVKCPLDALVTFYKFDRATGRAALEALRQRPRACEYYTECFLHFYFRVTGHTYNTMLPDEMQRHDMIDCLNSRNSTFAVTQIVDDPADPLCEGCRVARMFGGSRGNGYG